MERVIVSTLFLVAIVGCVTTSPHKDISAPIKLESATESSTVATSELVGEGHRLPSDKEEVPLAAAPLNDQKGGNIANGYAVVQGDVGQAKDAAIMSALGAAIQDKLGAGVTGQGVAKSFLLKEHRMKSSAKGGLASYELLDESEKDGLYRVKLRVVFDEAMLKSAAAQQVSVLVGGHEAIVDGGRRGSGNAARKAVAAALTESHMLAAVADGEILRVDALVQLARQKQNDLALYVGAETKQFDKFGEFYSFKTVIDFEVVIPKSGQAIVAGHIEGVNKERLLSTEAAAAQSLRDVGQTAAGEVLRKLNQRYDHAVSYTVYVLNMADRKQAEALVAQLKTVPGVQEARLVTSEKSVHAFGMTISPSARNAIPGAVQRFHNPDLDVIQSDLYTAVAMVRQSAGTQN